jgi:hypothetical protein
VPRRIKPDIPPGAAQKIAKALDDIDAPKPRRVARPGPDESRLAQAARLRDGNRQNVYGGMSMDYNGHRYSTHGRSSGDAHAEGDLLGRMRRQIADREGIRPEQVDLRQGSDARVYSEFSPCDTPKRNCRRLLDDSLPPGTEVTYSWPSSPRSARDASIDARDDAVGQLFQNGTPGPMP